MIIGLVGKKGSGKDTVGAYLVKEHAFERKAFADLVKKSIARTFDIPYQNIEKYKNDKTAHVMLTVNGQVVRDVPFRTFMQYFATEGHREIFGSDFWVEEILPTDGYYAGRKIVLTDCRFKSEADRIRMLGGFLVAIDKRIPLAEQDPHSSEVLSDIGPVEYRIDNNSTIEDLFKETEKMLDNLGSRGVRF